MADIISSSGLHTVLAAELFTRCISADGKAFTMRRYLGIYRQHFIRTESGWQCDRSTDTAPILAMTAQVREFVALYPELQATYPHTVTQDERSITPKDETWVVSEASAVIEVSAGFVSRHSGNEFLQQLLAEQPAAVAALADAVKQRLQRYEIRTAQMFPQGGNHLHIAFTVQNDAVCSDIWHLPLHHWELPVLDGSHRRCGLARALAEQLAASLSCHTAVCCSYSQKEGQIYTVQLTVKDLEL